MNLPTIDIEGFADLTILSILKSYILQSCRGGGLEPP